MRAPAAPLLFALALALVACEDPARPIPASGERGSIFVESDPGGAHVRIDGDDTGETTPILLERVPVGLRLVSVEFDSAGFTYSGSTMLDVAQDVVRSALIPLVVRCSDRPCVRANSQFHSPQRARFAVNATGPLFLFEGDDQGIVWPVTTSNSYAALGAPSFAASTATGPLALGLANAGASAGFWAGRPGVDIDPRDPYVVTVPAWITPPASDLPTMMRGIGITQRVSVEAATPDALHVRVTWHNISDDSVYRALDDGVPSGGITFDDVWVGFILDADIGSFGESNDDLVSYDADRNMAFAYDSDFAVAGFSGGWNTRPALVGLMLVEGSTGDARLNAWPQAQGFLTGESDDVGRLLITATQSTPPNHPHARIGFAPNETADDYLLSVATGPFTLAPGDSVSARFAVLIAPPVTGAFTSGGFMAAGDPLDASRPLAAAAGALAALADQVLGVPPN